MTPTEVKASYRRLLDRSGESCTIERLTGNDGNGNPTVTATAVVTMKLAEAADKQVSTEHAVVGRAAIVLHDDLVAASFPVPPAEGDRVKTANRIAQVLAVDGAARRIGGVQIAWDLVLSGP